MAIRIKYNSDKIYEIEFAYELNTGSIQSTGAKEHFKGLNEKLTATLKEDVFELLDDDYLEEISGMMSILF